MKQFYKIVMAVAVCVSACTNSTINNNKVAVDSTMTDNKAINNSQPDITPTDTSTTITFNEITLVFSRLMVVDENNSLKQMQNDTCKLLAEVGETILGQHIRIISSQLTELKIEQCYETSISISNEGPHCDLLNWKHYISDWRLLKSIDRNSYRCEDYSEEEKKQFPTIDINELKNKVMDQCGDEWYKLIKNITDPKQYPIEVGISRIYIRITGMLNNKLLTKIIMFEEAMGC